MKKKLINDTTEHFEKQFQHKPEAIFLSPGRINIIGEHVDYNDGFVLPAAINKYICFAIATNDTGICTIVAKDLNDAYKFNSTDEIKPTDKMWVNYILGVLQQLKSKGLPNTGFDIVFSSTIPMGAGLSSSAALECGIGYSMNNIFKLNLSKEDIAKIGQQSEHTFVGVKCGIMDQFASVFGKKKKVIRLDCTTLEYDYHNADFKKYSLLLLDSHVKHTHLTSGYNIRRQEVEEGITIIKNNFPHVKSFRDCTEEHLVTLKDSLGPILFKRCHFVVSEIQRVQDAVDSLETSNYQKLGNLMYTTHDGLSKKYEVSCPELDFLVDFVRKETNVIGARMMGGGFGGCSINLVEKGTENELIEKISIAYLQEFGIKLSAYKVKIGKGTNKVKIKSNQT